MEKNLVYTFTFFMIMGSYQRAGKANREKCLAMLCESGIRKTFPILYDKTCLSFSFSTSDGTKNNMNIQFQGWWIEKISNGNFENCRKIGEFVKRIVSINYYCQVWLLISPSFLSKLRKNLEKPQIFYF